jgi:DNA-binding CsgD family transcriptional regulator
LASPSMRRMTDTQRTTHEHAALSSRELQVLEMASLGLRNAQIAERLGLSVHAIKFHLAAVYKKLGVTNRTEAVVAYMRLVPARSGATGDLVA